MAFLFYISIVIKQTKQTMPKPNEFFVNRMPICQMVYKEAAEMMNHDENFAKSLAVARSIFFAAAKKGFKNKNGKHYNGVDSPSMEIPEIYSIPFAGIDAFCLNTENGPVSCLLDGTIFYPEQYDKYTQQKIVNLVGDEGYDKMKNEIRNRLSKLNSEELNSDRVYGIYASLRDHIRSTKFINS
jgi:hypothetical protein